MSLERYDEAEASLVRASESGTPEAFNNLGILRKKQGRLDEAIAAFERAIERNPSFADALYNLGNAHRAKDDLRNRRRMLSPRCGQRIPRMPMRSAALSQTLRAQGELAESLREFADAASSYRAALQLDPAPL